MRTRGVIASVLVVGVAFGGGRIFGTLQAGGAFREARTNYDMTCSNVAGVPGPEDLVVDRSSGIVFISSHDRRVDLAAGDEDNTVRGAIFAFDPARPSFGFVELTGVVDYGPGPADFRPHGLSLYTGPDGMRTLMVINHPHGEESTVEIYDVVDPQDPGSLPSLRYRVTVSSPSLISPNDLVAIDSVRFYATNDHGFANPRLRVFEDYLRLNVGSVVYFDGEMFSEVLGGLTFANGIEVSADGKTLYVAETTDTRIGAYGVEPESGGLSLQREWDLDFGVDNIDRAADGSLWIGGHPKMLDFIAHASDPQMPSPGKVVRIDPASEAAPEVVFEEKGLLISGLSVAVEHEGNVFMGKVFDDGLLICTQ